MNEPETEPPRRCKFGLVCYCGHDNGCTIHGWKNRHRDAYLIIITSSIIATAVMLVIIGVILNWEVNIVPAREVIDGYSCLDLAEYVADKKPEYSYAEHRYEWLCVNEQIKEFQG